MKWDFLHIPDAHQRTSAHRTSRSAFVNIGDRKHPFVGGRAKCTCFEMFFFSSVFSPTECKTTTTKSRWLTGSGNKFVSLILTVSVAAIRNSKDFSALATLIWKRKLRCQRPPPGRGERTSNFGSYSVHMHPELNRVTHVPELCQCIPWTSISHIHKEPDEPVWNMCKSSRSFELWKVFCSAVNSKQFDRLNFILIRREQVSLRVKQDASQG